MLTRRFGLILTLLLVLVSPRASFAHPMGNFSVNHYTKITVQNDRIRLQYIIDLAEIPTFQELQQGNISASPDDPAVKRYIAERGAELGHGLSLSLDGKPLGLSMKSSSVIFPPGAGGLPTMKMGFVYESVYPPALNRTHAGLHFADGNYAGQAGWKEIIALAAVGTLGKSSVPTTDRSDGLTNYSTDLLNSPPQVLDASIETALPAAPIATSSAAVSALAAASTAKLTSAKAAAPTSKPATGQIVQSGALEGPPAVFQTAIPLEANQQHTPRSKFTELITAQNLSLWFLFTAALIAVGLGALHALEPGHGKTIVAAYLVGSRGTARHAALLGLIVTVSHTAGVFALGGITLYASRYIVPEQLYPWLGVLSGLIIAGLGCYMFLRRLTGTAAEHSHADGSGHWPFFKRPVAQIGEPSSSDPRIAVVAEGTSKPISMPQLFALGITGGIIPCPAALIVLLSAFALHRIALGFFLIVAFSLGLAGVLIAFGMLMVYARRFMLHLSVDGPLTKLWLPLVSSAFITILGVGLTIQGLAGTHLNASAFSQERLGPVLFVIGLGLILGVRHSTDADHVVAISTIVSKQRNIRSAAVLGSVWGLGHTITISIVGALIILFGVKISPRVGLTMEFCVALMLILLGVLNLSGIMQKITTHFTRIAIDRDTTAGSASRLRRSLERFGSYQFIRPLAIGLVHGLAGSAAVALLVLSTIRDPIKATMYLLIFGVGTMIGMMGMTAMMAVPLAYAGKRFSQVSRYLEIATGVVSLCFGSFLVYQLGFLGGLFTTHPHWTPS